MPSLPIHSLLSEILAAWERLPNLVLEAPTGAGKTTALPLAILEANWRQGQKILLLEPRRLPTRAAAERLASQIGEPIGGRVGYQVRLERKIGPKTELEVLTYGLFLRRIQSDPELKNIGLVLFDEFHERSVEADLAFAFSLDVQQSLRPDLRLGLLSATFDGADLAARIPNAKRLRSDGRLFPIETIYAGTDGDLLEDRVARILRQALNETTGDILVFLPGSAEIHRVGQRIEDLSSRYSILGLHGDLALSDQDRVVKPDPKGLRKIILSTNIAETSLTIEGVRIVIDSGLKRSPAFDPASGMTRLVTRRVSLAEADQRKGRAGRTAPGICYRLWSASEERALARFASPEIREIDLCAFALEVAAWGSDALLFLDEPPKAPLQQARALLCDLGALDKETMRITDRGRKMANFGTHPRLARMMIQGKALGHGELAADIAAILSERDPLRSTDCDLRDRLDFLWGDLKGIGRRDSFLRLAQSFRRQLRIPEKTGRLDREKTGALLALAYPERIAQQRGGQFRMANGKGAILPSSDRLQGKKFLAIAALDGKDTPSKIFLAAPLAQEEIEAEFAPAIQIRRRIEWDRLSESVVAMEEKILGGLVLDEKPLRDVSPETLVPAMIEGIRQMGLQVLPWDTESRHLQARLCFLQKQLGEDWPSFEDSSLLRDMEAWLAPYLQGKIRKMHLADLDLQEALLARLDWQQKKKLEELAPRHYKVPSGSYHRIEYENEIPSLAVRLQEMFGLSDHPRIAGGKVALQLHLLSPARRPVQVTSDLKGFWQNSYFAVRKDLRGQYPKHDWPENPSAAIPTTRTKRRS